MRYNKSVTHRFPALIAAPPPAPGRLWLTGAQLFDGTGTPLRQDTAVLIEDGGGAVAPVHSESLQYRGATEW